MAKDFVSFPDLNSGLGGIDLLADAARKTLGEDASNNKTLFKALVLRAVSGQELSETTMANVQGADEVRGNRTRSTGARAYFVKILEDSPHRYLPDACPDGTPGVANIGNNHLIQSMYTYAIDKSGGSLSPNDVVLVRLERKDFGYDTDTGTIEGVIGARESEKIIREAELGCGSPMKAHKDPKKKKRPVSTVVIPTTQSGQTSPTAIKLVDMVDIENVTGSHSVIIKYSRYASGTPKVKGTADVKKFLIDLRDELEKPEYADEAGKPIVPVIWVTNSFRSPNYMAAILVRTLTVQNIKSLYSNGLWASGTKYPNIDDLVKVAGKDNPDADIKKVEKMVSENFNKGRHLSRHQYGQAFDISAKSPKTMTTKQAQALAKAVNKLGAVKFLFEPVKGGAWKNNTSETVEFVKYINNAHMHITVPEGYAPEPRELLAAASTDTATSATSAETESFFQPLFDFFAS